MFIDKVTIRIKAGNGGNGAVSLLQNKQTMKGGPDGGDGGNGGSIIFHTNQSINTLYNFKFKRKFIAENGSDGGKFNKFGPKGKDTTIEIPVGTVIYDAETNKPIADLNEEDMYFTCLKGGMGGHGNAFYATSTRQTPRFAQSGEITKEHDVILELKTLADVGLVGYPNVGKSTLLSVISNARPKIADYAFTTITPNLGVTEYYGNSFVVADIPGLIEGASEGVGLGHEFLRHIERVRLILHLIDISESEGRNINDDFDVINNELKKYSEKLSNLPQIVVFTKCDLLEENVINEKIENFKKHLEEVKKNYEILAISSIMHKNLEPLKDKIWSKLETIPKTAPTEIEEFDFDKRDTTSLEIKREDSGAFVISGGYIDHLARGIMISDYNSFAYFQLRLKKDGVIDKLKEKGLKEGDTVKIKDFTFEYSE